MCEALSLSLHTQGMKRDAGRRGSPIALAFQGTDSLHPSSYGAEMTLV